MKLRIKSKNYSVALSLALLAGSTGAYAATIIASDDFESGLASGGSGAWSNDWTNGTNTSGGSVDFSASATPLDSNGNYASIVGTGGVGTRGIHRTVDFGADITLEHTISFLMRVDGELTGSGDASRAIVAQGGNAFGLSATTTWAVYVQDGTFRYFDGNGDGGFAGAAKDSGEDVIVDTVYSVTITNRIGAGTTTGGEYDLLVTAGGSDVLNLTDLNYREDAAVSSSIIGLGVAGSNTSSYDEVVIVPEPSSLVPLLGLGGLALILRRRK